MMESKRQVVQKVSADRRKVVQKLVAQSEGEQQVRRSRWIATLILSVLLVGGAVLIAGRVLPYVNSNVQDGLYGLMGEMGVSGEMMGGSGSGGDIGVNMGINGVGQMMEPVGDFAQSEGIVLDGRQAVKSRAVATSEMVSSSIMPPMMDDGAVPGEDNRVIRTGRLDVVVGNIDTALGRVREIARSFDGVIASSQFWVGADSGDEVRAGSVTVRVPVAQFDATLEALRDAAIEVSSESTNTQDVTEEFVDLKAQLANKKRQETRLQELFDRAQKVDDLIKIERELSRVRGDIERFEGRLRYMEARTDYSTITITMKEDVKVATITERQWRPAVVAREAVNGLMRDVENFLSVAILFLARFIPLFALYALCIWVVWIVAKKVYKRFETKSNSKLNDSK